MPGKKKEKVIWRILFRELKMLCWMQTVAGEKINLCAVGFPYIKQNTLKMFKNNEQHIQNILKTSIYKKEGDVWVTSYV